MSIEETTLATLLAKEEIRELAMLYSRGVDRKDIELLRTLYAKDATDHHGRFFSGSADDYLRFLEKSFPSTAIRAKVRFMRSRITCCRTPRAAMSRTSRLSATSTATARRTVAGC